MRQRFLMFLIIAFGALLQQFLASWPLVGGIKPPILAAMALHYALRKNKEDIWLAVFFAALLRDGLDIGPFGPAMLAFPVLGICAYRIRNEVFSDGLLTQLALGALMGLFTTLATLLIYVATGQRAVPPSVAFLRLFSSIWLGMATLPLVTRSINVLEAVLPKRRRYGWQ